ncbi:MAG: AMP-binding protein [Kiritimatiellae bacterium]|nr:AMP-binding protein [Kiritimatiellia bacterium]
MATIRTLLLDAAAKSSDRTFLRWKSNKVWHSWTFNEVYKRTRIVSEVAHKLGAKHGTTVALMMENRPEWIITYLGLSSIGCCVVPIDARLQEGEVSYILRDAQVHAVFASGRIWPTLNAVMDTLPELRHIVLLDGVVSKDMKDGRVRIHDFTQINDECQEKAMQPDAFFDRSVPVETDVTSIIYTSGTTGRPKGAMLTHGNFTAQLDEGALKYFKVYEDDNFLLVLPLHHAFAFSANLLVPLRCRCEISIVENLRTVAENMKEVSPTILLAVPLLAEKMLNAVMTKLNKNKIAVFMLKCGLGKIIGNKVRKGLGGRLRLIICGGAASDKEMLKNYRKLGISSFEGYGLTETAPICALNPENSVKLGTVGKALPNCEIRIYNPNEEGVGEIQVKGPVVMKGYFRNEAATAACMDGEWFMTGDLGHKDSEGYVTITGRKKCMIVNREGKNIYPEEVEQAINNSPWILESLVVGYTEEGDSAERVGAIIVPNLDYFAAHRDGFQARSDEEIIAKCREEVQKMVGELSTYKRPRKLAFRMEPFEKTTTLKIKRFLYSM